MKSDKKKVIILSVCILAAVLFVVWTAWGNSALMINEITVRSERIPESFSGFRIAQVSDLHNAEFGDNNSELIKMLRDSKPDIIVITGDLVDANNTDIGIASAFVHQAVEIAPTYYVNGNHEANISDYPYLRECLESAGAVLLENRSVILEKDGESIVLAGLNDMFFEGSFEENLRMLTADKEHYIVLLSHRPEYFDAYAECGADLVFSGHAHGGQFRLPLIGGIAAPGQGFFPKYDSGKYTEGATEMIVSRGIGNSIIPFRINNRPEIVLAVLESI